MPDSRAAARHAAEGLALWQQDRFDEAEAEYQAALAAAPVDDPARADYHSELAAVLEAAGKHHAAEQQLRAALASERALAGDGDATGVNVARYFLAGFLVRHGEARTALDDIAPHLVPHAGGVWLLHAVAAEAWLAVADADAADAAARLALRAAPSDDQRSELRLRFLEIGLHDAAI
ncbi:MAG: hypothetical protein IPM80_14250 [Proteobacteria bacterium]|nr:hypothetical protein [Pseudomonadota bacterium]